MGVSGEVENSPLDFITLLTNPQEKIFRDRFYLTERYIPSEIPQRAKELKIIFDYIRPTFVAGGHVKDLIILGLPGTGKTLTLKYIKDKLDELAKKSPIPIEMYYFNCIYGKGSNSEYKLLINLCATLGKPMKKGTSIEFLYSTFSDLVDKSGKNIVLILDEIDKVIKNSKDKSEFLYNFSRMHLELKNPKSKLTIIGITSDFNFNELLEVNARDSFKYDAIVFSPYNADQILSILSERAQKSLWSTVFNSGIIAKCAAISATNQGNARYALNLLYTAADVAEKNKLPRLNDDLLAISKVIIEKEHLLSAIKSFSRNEQLVYYTILKLHKKGVDPINTGDICQLSNKLCGEQGIPHIGVTRISDILSTFDACGLISAIKVYRGRYGQTREVKIFVDEFTLNNLLSDLDKNFSVL